MALLRARAVYGTDTARAAVDRIVAEVLASPRDGEAVAKDAAGMRDKMAAHKPPKGALDVKNGPGGLVDLEFAMQVTQLASGRCHDPHIPTALACLRSEEHTSELQSLMRISYAVFCMKKKTRHR